MSALREHYGLKSDIAPGPRSAGSENRSSMNLFQQRYPMDKNMTLIVSAERHDRTAAESVRPSSEKRHTALRSVKTVEGIVRRVWTRRVDIGALLGLSRTDAISSLSCRLPFGSAAEIRAMGVRVIAADRLWL